jgi:ribonuclease P protein component
MRSRTALAGILRVPCRRQELTRSQRFRRATHVEAHISAQQSAAVQAPRLPAPHAYTRRPDDHRPSSREGPLSTVGVAGSLTTSTSDVGRVLSTGRAFHGNRVVLFVAPGTGKVAFVAGRRVGRAVLRNRARRIMRAAWRELAPTVPDDYDVALVARGTIQGARSRDLVTEVDELLSRARVTRS